MLPAIPRSRELTELPTKLEWKIPLSLLRVVGEKSSNRSTRLLPNLDKETFSYFLNPLKNAQHIKHNIIISSPNYDQKNFHESPTQAFGKLRDLIQFSVIRCKKTSSLAERNVF